MNKENFLEDFNPFDYEIVNEGENEEKKYYMRGIFSYINVPNKNKRIYTKEVMEEALESVKPLVEGRGLVGELDHPTDQNPKVNVPNISHVITKLDLNEDGQVIGEIEALDTVPGKHLQSLMKSKIRLGVSTRGNGTLAPYVGDLGEGFFMVRPGYKLHAVDIVFEPSAGTFPSYVKEETEEEEEENKIKVGYTIKLKEVWESVFNS